jgi:uncharacterized protein YecE (DUF72 family)
MRQANDRPAHAIYVGTSGWSYADWEGVVYPSAQRTGRFDPLTFMARYFDALEINVSFYRPLTVRMTDSWVRRLGPDRSLQFAVKLHQRFTHQRDQMFTGRQVDEFLAGLEPLLDAGRLGPMLLQFPWSFRNTPRARDWLKLLADAFGHLPLTCEVRHDSWATDDALALMGRLGLSFCNIDQPRLGHCIGPTAIANARIGYIRLHGRNRDAWFDPKADGNQRYDYLYAEAELAEWVDRIRDVAAEADQTYVFTNNHYRGQAPANALQLKSMLTGGRVPIPPMLAATYPALTWIATEEPGRQRMLFD